MADVTSIYGNPIKDAVARADISTLQTDVQDVKDGLQTVEDITVTTYTKSESIGVTLTASKILNPDGSLADFSNSGYGVSNLIDISSYDKLYITASSGWNHLLYAFYDADSAFISGLNSGSSTLIITLQEAQIPSGAKYVRIARIGGLAYALNGLIVISGNSARLKWVGKKWVCVGDSLTAVNTATTKHYFDYISEITGITVVNMGDSGSGYRTEQDQGTAFYQRISDVPTDSDVVTIFGSFNDGLTDLGTATDSGTTTVGGCINTTIDNLYAVMPTVQLGIVSPTPWVGANPYNHSEANAYAELLENICKRRSIPFLNLYYESNLRPWDSTFRTLAYSKDNGNGVHPDETGHKIIASRFLGFLDSLLT